MRSKLRSEITPINSLVSFGGRSNNTSLPAIENDSIPTTWTPSFWQTSMRPPLDFPENFQEE